MNNQDVISEAKLILADYIEKNTNFRKSQERFAILETIYANYMHFDVESLMCRMNENVKFKVSRATFYNTINLLVKCRLLNRIYTGANGNIYEITLGVKPHYHLICTECGEIRDCTSNKAEIVVNNTMKYTRFRPQSYTLTVYGVCSKCTARIRKEKKDATSALSKNK